MGNDSYDVPDGELIKRRIIRSSNDDEDDHMKKIKGQKEFVIYMCVRTTITTKIYRFT